MRIDYLAMVIWTLGSMLAGMLVVIYGWPWEDTREDRPLNPVPALQAAVADRLPAPPRRLRPRALPPPVPPLAARNAFWNDGDDDQDDDQPLTAEPGEEFTLTPQLAAWTRRKPARPEPAAGQGDGWTEHVINRLRDPDDPGAEHWLRDLDRTATP